MFNPSDQDAQPSHPQVVTVRFAHLDVLCWISHWGAAPSDLLTCNGRTRRYCSPHLASGGVPASSDRHKACPVKFLSGLKNLRRPVLQVSTGLKPTVHVTKVYKNHPVIGCLHQSSMAMRHHPDLLRCESPHANASVLRDREDPECREPAESTVAFPPST